MIFKITRISDYKKPPSKPCLGAYEAKENVLEELRLGSLAELDEKIESGEINPEDLVGEIQELKYSIRGSIRVHDKFCWKIEVNSIEHLLAIIKEVGPLVINEQSILIYDDYRE
jgi:hypothetical protein